MQDMEQIVRMLTDIEVAKYLNVSIQKVRLMRKVGDGPPFIRIGKNIRYSMDGLREWMRSLPTTGGKRTPKVVVAQKPAVIHVDEIFS